MIYHDHLAFLKASFSNLRDTGSFVPSSVFLAERLVEPIYTSFKKEITVVELGAGTGSVTKKLLEILDSKSKLLALELNPVLANRLSFTYNGPRCEIVSGDAQNLSDILHQKGLKKVDFIVSGLPLANIRSEVRENIYKEIKKCLKPEGVYTQFQYFLSNFSELKKHFEIRELAFEWRNLPPAFVYTSKLF